MGPRPNTRRPPSRRQPFRDVSNRVNIPQSSVQQTPDDSSPVVRKSSMPVNSSSNPNTDCTSSSPVTTPVENKRISSVSESQPNSKRNSAISTTSTASGKSRRKTHIGPWQLGRTLGKGSTGRVRLAKHAVTGQVAAIKIVSKKSAAMTQSQSIAVMGQNLDIGNGATGTRVMPYGIEREVVIMKLIEHPNIINLYDVWENRGELYLVLEYVEGGELFDYVSEKGALPEIEAVRLFRQIIAGLAYCHQFNICHRDLKPENILLDKECNIKLADFGMAALQPAGHWLNTSCGSPHYASPEVVHGLRYQGNKADIWSCGVILFALLAGYLPFDGGDLCNTLRLVKKGEYVMPPWLSDEAMDLIQRILQKQPSHRITMAEIWYHPLLKKYEEYHIAMSPHSTSIDPPRPFPAEGSGQFVLRRQDIDMDIVRSLQTLWHGIKSEELVTKLLGKGMNHEKLFYRALIKFREEQLENYEGPLEYSTSDYHHIPKAAVRSRHSRFPSSRAQSQNWRRSQFSIAATDKSYSREVPYNEIRSVGTVSSYDPYRSSRNPICNPDVEYANITIHRPSSDRSSSNDGDNSYSYPDGGARAFSKRDKANCPFLVPASAAGTPGRSNAGRNSMRSFQTRSSLASHRRRNASGAVAHSASYKRNVSFRHVRNRSVGNIGSRPSGSRSQYSLSRDATSSLRPGYERDRPFPSDRFSSPGLPTPPPIVRTRKAPTQADKLDVDKHRASCQIWKDEARKVSMELGKICEEAFNQSSISSITPTVETCSAKRSESPSTSITTPVDIGGPVDRRNPSGLSKLQPEPADSFATKELTETRRRLLEHSIRATADGLPDYLSEVITHLDRLIAREAMSNTDTAQHILTDPPAVKPSGSVYLPSISEESVPTPSNKVESDPLQLGRVGSNSGKAESLQKKQTIRVVPHDSSPVRDFIKPLTIRKRSTVPPTLQSSTGPTLPGFDSSPSLTSEGWRTPPGNRISSGVRFYADLEPIEEDPKLAKSDSQRTGESKKWSWFKQKSRHEEAPPPPPSKDAPLPPPNLSTGPSVANSVSSSGFSARWANQPEKTLEKKRSFLKFFGRKKTSKPTHELEGASANDHNDAASSIISVPASEKSVKTPNHVDATRKEKPYRHSNSNWLARFFHIRPASNIIAFNVSKARARKEVIKVLRGWKKYGMESIRVDKEINTVYGRVGEVNFLRLPAVDFSGQFFTVLEHGRPSNLSLLRLRQEKGAASSLQKVVDTLRGVLKQRGLMVEKSSQARKMAKLLDGTP
ncbi:CAMK/CAMKL/GIN4 protein kinase [Polytolypa hystricis UAMH7299]|uniref:non-specific serine/threonine protein kinase n=1 Tax=Polytolypa hystricis (strain UAMH7299) TaxID=1447883 RepID=A0A2B7Z0L8_POLH7|nr:CAMK/CAMKL/GIN4 protein kinase [Polytolypa hystricis UAMH7299]